MSLVFGDPEMANELEMASQGRGGERHKHELPQKDDLYALQQSEIKARSVWSIFRRGDLRPFSSMKYCVNSLIPFGFLWLQV